MVENSLGTVFELDFVEKLNQVKKLMKEDFGSIKIGVTFLFEDYLLNRKAIVEKYIKKKREVK